MTIPSILAPLIVSGVVAACPGPRTGAGQEGGGGAAVTARSIDAVLAAHNDSLLALPGVVGTAIARCDGAPCIKVLLAEANPEARARIPARLEGYRVVIEVTGTLRPR